jgi:hypothetical protein
VNVGQTASDKEAFDPINHILKHCFSNCRDNQWCGIQYAEDCIDWHEIDSVPVLIANSLNVSRQPYDRTTRAPPKYLIH